MGREKDDRGNGKEKRLEASGTSSSLPLLGLSLKLKIILVVTARFVEHLLCARHSSKKFTCITEP